MKNCPVCCGKAERMAGQTWCAADDKQKCVLAQHCMPEAIWDALPRVVPNAEALVDAFASASFQTERCRVISDDPKWCTIHACDTDVCQRATDAAHAALLRACVVAEDAETVRSVSGMRAEVASLRVQRDALAELEAKLRKVLDFQRRRIIVVKAQRDEARVQRDALARQPATFTRVSTAGAHTTDLRLHTGDAYLLTINGETWMMTPRATGVPEAELRAASNRRGGQRMFPPAPRTEPAAPPVAEDADALLDALLQAAADSWRAEEYLTLRDAARARMRPEVTAEALWKCASPLLKNHMTFAMCEELSAALAALGGGK